jgi:hypothetical protein
VVALKRELEFEKNVFRKQSSDNSPIMQLSYRVAHLLRQEGKPFSDRRFLKKEADTYCKKFIRKRKLLLIL